MSTPKKWTLVLAASSAVVLVACALPADESKAPEPGPLVVVDHAGKEQKLKSWKFTTGTRRLGWLAPAEKEGDPKEKVEPKKDKDDGRAAPKAAPKAKPAAGPEALEFREENSTAFVEGVLTLIPLDRVRSVEYDNDKQTVSLVAAGGPKAEDDQKLTGLTKFQKINKLVIEAEVDKGDLGVAEVKFLGGVPKGLRSVRFPEVKAAALPAGRPALVTTADSKGKSTHKVSDLQPLYRSETGDREQLSPLLMFKKTLKVDVAKIQKIVPATGGEEGTWQVVLKDGGDETLTLLTKTTLDGKPVVLEGLLGRVPAGYKLFPIHTLAEIEFDAKEER